MNTNYSVNFLDTEKNVFHLLNQSEYLKEFTKSPRTVGDYVEEIVRKNISSLISGISNYEEVFARRAMADVAFEDVSKRYYFVDVKTHNLKTDFNMPNLTSVKRIAQFYQDDNNSFCLIKEDYEPNPAIVKAVHFLPIEHLEWTCLTIGALGWGQIQIANANHVHINRNQSRKTWMLGLCRALEAFYPNEIEKINERITFFSEVKRYWENKI